MKLKPHTAWKREPCLFSQETEKYFNDPGIVVQYLETNKDFPMFTEGQKLSGKELERMLTGPLKIPIFQKTFMLIHYKM